MIFKPSVDGRISDASDVSDLSVNTESIATFARAQKPSAAPNPWVERAPAVRFLLYAAARRPIFLHRDPEKSRSVLDNPAPGAQNRQNEAPGVSFGSPTPGTAAQFDSGRI
jgi:hypothetical protein